MRTEALLFFATTQIALLFDLSRPALACLVTLGAAIVLIKAYGDRRRVDAVSVATVLFSVAVAILVPWSIEVEEARGADFMVEVTLDGETVEGQALVWRSNQVTLFGRDGRLHRFHPNEGADLRKTAEQFAPLPAAKLRADLLREFGPAFDVSGVGHYLVVHPRGQRDRWASRFDEFYRSFSVYFASRGFDVQPPKCPLIAVVFPTQQQFRQYAAKHGDRPQRDVLGYYSAQTNRILLYDGAGSDHSPLPWQITAETIVHEVTHQAAFNTGVHHRLRMPPRWVAEGLGTMFEAPGFHKSTQRQSRLDRVNQYQWRLFQRSLPQRRDGTMIDLVASETPFSLRPQAAYAEAWALTFFLAETRPRQYAAYLQATARGRGGMRDSVAERLAVFKTHFGRDLTLLESQFVRFYRDLGEQ